MKGKNSQTVINLIKKKYNIDDNLFKKKAD
jgi:hypothetical protein